MRADTLEDLGDFVEMQAFRANRENRKDRDEATPGANDWPPRIDFAALAGTDPQPPRFIVRDWLPVGYATLLAGHGGIGKSAIGLHMCACIALGRPFFGLETDQRRVLYLSCEDRTGLLHWRLTHICRYLGIGLADLAGKLDVLDLVGHDATLWARDPKTGYTVTLPSEQLASRIREYRSQLLTVDGISDTFGGNENARTDVKRFVNALLGMVPADDGALLLLGHVSKPTASGNGTTEGYSGSTAWHNAVRSRMYLYAEFERDENDRMQRTGSLTLELQKSNLGGAGPMLTFKWDDAAHLFVAGRQDGGGIVDSIRERTESTGILRALAGCELADVYVPAATRGERNAYLVLASRPEFPDTLRGGSQAKKRRFYRHLEALRQIRHVAESSIRRANRHAVATLELTTEGRAACVG